MSLLEGLNNEQQKAVQSIEGPLLLLAGAGSGKTRVLTHRIAYLIEGGIQPYRILAITFTNKAAKEMKERVEHLAERGEEVWVATFHATCVRLLRQEMRNIGEQSNFTIYDSDDSQRLLKTCIMEVGLDIKQYPVRGVASVIGSFKDELLSPTEAMKKNMGDYRQEQFAKVYSRYQKRLKEMNALDFDDIIFRTVELFHFHPDILEKYQNRFQYILVDEYQDTNTAQYTLIKQLAGKHKNLCVVGDDDQSIYGWRGANIRNILDFEKDFINAQMIKLEQNYRSTQTILNAANTVIKNNYGRKDKSLWTNNNKGEKIKLYIASTDLEEGVFIANVILREVAQGKQYSDFAILYRTNSQSRIIEDAFVKKSIPYRLFGGVRFYERKEIKDVLAYLKAVYNPSDDIALRRIINIPKRGIGDTTIDKVNDYARENDLTFFQALQELDMIPALKTRVKKLQEFVAFFEELIELAQNNKVSELLKKIIDDTKYIEALQIEETEEAQGRIENIQEFMNKVLEYESKAEDTTLQGFLEEVSLVADIDNYSESEDTVVLMTIHSSKGLEFPVVFLAGVEEGIFPSYRSIVSETEKALEEERRLCYVGITRAKSQLYITCADCRRQNGQMMNNLPSRFIKEIQREYIEPFHQKQVVQKSTIPQRSRTLEPMFKKTEPSTFSAPKNVMLDYTVGDQVRQMKYGIGTVLEIKPAGADFEVTISFKEHGIKKFMSRLSKIRKA